MRHSIRIRVLYLLIRGYDLSAIVLFVLEVFYYLNCSFWCCQLYSEMWVDWRVVQSNNLLLGEVIYNRLRNLALWAECHILQNNHLPVLFRSFAFFAEEIPSPEVLCLWSYLIGRIRTHHFLSCCMFILRRTQTLIDSGWCDCCGGSLSLIWVVPELLGSLKTGVYVCIVRIQNVIRIVMTLIEPSESWLMIK